MRTLCLLEDWTENLLLAGTRSNPAEPRAAQVHSVTPLQICVPQEGLVSFLLLPAVRRAVHQHQVTWDAWCCRVRRELLMLLLVSAPGWLTWALPYPPIWPLPIPFGPSHPPTGQTSRHAVKVWSTWLSWTPQTCYSPHQTTAMQPAGLPQTLLPRPTPKTRSECMPAPSTPYLIVPHSQFPGGHADKASLKQAARSVLILVLGSTCRMRRRCQSSVSTCAKPSAGAAAEYNMGDCGGHRLWVCHFGESRYHLLRVRPFIIMHADLSALFTLLLFGRNPA